VLSWKFPKSVGKSLTLIGRSRAAHATGFAIPELEWQLDAGAVVHGQKPWCIFVTHTHTDHAHLLTQFRARRKPPIIFLPYSAVPLVENFLTAVQEMTDNQVRDTVNNPWITSYTMHPLQPPEQVLLTKGDKPTDLVLDVVECTHSVPCVGFCFSHRVKKLKAEYQGLSSNEIAQLRKSGTAVTEEVDKPLFAFMGDTTPKVFEENEWLTTCPVVITECTFLEDDEIENAERTKHTHWRDLAPIIRANPQCEFVLIHFSKRYTDSQIRQFFAREENSLPNILPWVAPEE